jgi:hypothetical protein
LLFIIYTINLPVVRPRSYRFIYYFDTPALGRKHQSFGRVNKLAKLYVNEAIRLHGVPVFQLYRIGIQGSHRDCGLAYNRQCGQS